MTGPRPAAAPGCGPAVPSPWPLGRIIGGTVLLMALFSLAAVVVGVLALAHLDNERQRIETTIDPAALAAQQLYSALLNQETGVRGYALSGQPDFLAPYTEGYAAEKAAVTQLRKLLPQLPAASAADLHADAHPGPRLAHPLRRSRRSSRSRPAASRWSARTSWRARRSSTPCGSSSPPSRPTSPSTPAAGAELARPGLGRARTWPCWRSRSASCGGRGGAGHRAAQHRDPPGAPARRRGAAGRRRRFRPRGRLRPGRGRYAAWPPT